MQPKAPVGVNPLAPSSCDESHQGCGKQIQCCYRNLKGQLSLPLGGFYRGLLCLVGHSTKSCLYRICWQPLVQMQRLLLCPGSLSSSTCTLALSNFFKEKIITALVQVNYGSFCLINRLNVETLECQKF